MNVPAFVESGAGDTALFLLHGVGGGKQAWAAQTVTYARSGYRTIAWDAPGFGDTPVVAPYTLGEVALALGRLIDHIGAKRNVIIGHSMGGMIAQEAWAAYPEKIHGLVLVGTSSSFGKPDGAWQQEFLARRLAPLDAGRTMAELAPALVAGMLGPHPDPAGRQLAIEVMARVPASTYRAALQALVKFDRRALLATIAVPTLLISAEHDANAPAAVMEKMAARIPGAAYACLPGLGHLCCMENPPLFDAAVLGFLARHFPLVERSAGSGQELPMRSR